MWMREKYMQVDRENTLTHTHTTHNPSHSEMKEPQLHLRYGSGRHCYDEEGELLTAWLVEQHQTAAWVCVFVCVCVQMLCRLIKSACTHTERSGPVDIKCLHVAIHDVLFECRDCLARQSDTWSDGFWKLLSLNHKCFSWEADVVCSASTRSWRRR